MKRVIPTFVIAIAMFSVLPAAKAQTACSEAGNQREINACYTMQYKQVDRDLQSTYDSLRKKLPSESAAKLRETQRAWAVYKDGWCELESAAVKSGSMYPSIVARCLTKLTQEQLERLTYQNSCQDDVDCLPKR